MDPIPRTVPIDMTTTTTTTTEDTTNSPTETRETPPRNQMPLLSPADSLSTQSNLSLLDEEVLNGNHRNLGGGVLPVPADILHHRGIFEFEWSEVGVV